MARTKKTEEVLPLAIEDEMLRAHFVKTDFTANINNKKIAGKAGEQILLNEFEAKILHHHVIKLPH